MWLFLAKEQPAATVRQAQSKHLIHFKRFLEKNLKSFYFHPLLYIRTTLLNIHKVVQCINNAAFWFACDETHDEKNYNF